MTETAAVRPNATIEPAAFAANVRALLHEDPRRYRAFGVYWYLVKAVLKRFYDRHEMPMLGAYEDPTVIERMPPGLGLREYLELASAEYEDNARFNLDRDLVEDPHGEFFRLQDPDMGV